MSNIDYSGGGQDFKAKMAMFGAKMNQHQQQYGGNRKPKPPPRPQSNNNGYAANNNGYNANNGYQAMPQSHNVDNSGTIKPSGGFSNNAQQRAPRKILVKSKAARATGRNEHAIKVNLDSVKSKVKFGRLVVYSVNCLGILSMI